MEGQRVQATTQQPPAVVQTELALQLVEVTKRFPGVLANDRVSLGVRRGEVLGLLGENGAGKSTLMNIVYGLYHPDGGEIFVAGRQVSISSPQHALELGIGMVHQHFMLVPDMTVAENVALAPSLAPGLCRLSDVEQRLSALSQRFGLELDPRAVIEDLTVGARQRVEILKLLYRGAGLLILDEPTAALTPNEWEEMSRFLRSMADEGKSVIFISHKLDEQFGLVDRCTVLRDGRVIDTVAITQTDKAHLARMMVGRDVTLRVERPVVVPGAAILDVRSLTVVDEHDRTLVDDVGFQVHEGEIFGIAGVAGNGQSELVDAIVGLVEPNAGEISLGDKRLTKLQPRDFTKAGGALIPEDRHEEGIALDLSLVDNLLLKEMQSPAYTRRGFIDYDAARKRAEQLAAEYDVKTPGVDVPARQLSGGNQQKVVLAREMSRDPRLVIAFQPTRGLDVGAIEFVYNKLNEKKKEGGAVLLISFELDEILTLADRFAVIVNGRLLQVLESDKADPETVGLLMGGEASPA
ncbi:MAG TPA: ABC transporter ATP-binding protein [Conexibacter sp.]|jgi:simple sugar transport system ATP-binding protein